MNLHSMSAASSTLEVVTKPACASKSDRTPNFTLVDVPGEPQWLEIARHYYGSLFTCPQWINAIAKTHDFAIRASVRRNGGRIEAAVPYCEISDFRGDRIVSLPFSDYCDPLVTDRESWSQLIAPLLAHNVPVMLRCLRNDVPTGDSRFSREVLALWHAVDLMKSKDELWEGLTGSARQNIRKARNDGVVVREGRSIEDMRIFHRIHHSLRKSKYHLLAQPLSFFENIFHEFSPIDGINVLIAECDNEPIAGTVLLEWNGALYYKFNASLDQKHRPNDLLTWHSLLYGHRRGMVRLDFGLSGLEQIGLVRYKRKFATEERQVSFLEWRPEGYVNLKGEQAGQVLRQVTRWLTDASVPDEITRAAGEKLYRYFC